MGTVLIVLIAGVFDPDWCDDCGRHPDDHDVECIWYECPCSSAPEPCPTCKRIEAR